MMFHEDVIKYLKKHPHRYTYEQIAEHFFPGEGKKKRNKINGIITRAGKNEYVLKDAPGPRSFTTEEVMAKSSKQITAEARLESQLRAHTHKTKETDKKYKFLQDELERAKKQLDNALQIVSYKPQRIKIEVPQNAKNGEATAVALLSDVHCEELIEPHKVNYLNEHNPDISKRRVARFFELVTRFIRVDRGETTVENLVLWLGGDFFTNEMHGAPTAFPPITAAMFAQDMVMSGVQFLLKNEPKLKIHVVCSVGNHSRLQTQKPVNVALEQEHSLEWMMYHALRTRFESEKRVTWQLDNSYHSYVTVYDKVVRFNHGHLGWRYNDGLAGVHGPLWKVVTQKWDKQVKADLTCCGHYHTYTPSARARQYMVNGSTCGATPYGLQFGFEEPSQAYFLVHSKYGIVGQRPLFVNT